MNVEQRTRYLDHLRRDGDRVATLARGDLSVRVPTCPDWTLADLIEHTGFVHRWQTAAVRDNPVSFPPEETWRIGPAVNESVDDWFAAGVADAVAVMSAAAPSEPRWTWAGPADVGWYIRRITHETMVHRIDAELAAGIPSTAIVTDPDLAADGIEEMCDMFMPASAGEAVGGSGESVRLVALDTDVSWLITLHPDRVIGVRSTTDADAVVRGRAVDLLLMVWGRDPLQEVATNGDQAAIAKLRAYAQS